VTAIELAPTEVAPVGRILVATAYLATAWICTLAYKTQKQGPDRPLRQTVPALLRVLRKHWPHPPAPARRAAIWIGTATAMLVLAAATLLDLQGRVAELGRAMARSDGWYAQRQTLQAAAVLLILAAAGVIGLAARRLLAGHLREFAGLTTAGTFLATFILVRMISLHAVDDVMRASVLGVRLEWALELGGVTAIAGSGLWCILRALRARP
jgi:hypothetical protein